MVPFLVDCLENIVRGFCDGFILPDVLKKATNTSQLIKLDVMDEYFYWRDYNFSFSISHKLCVLKQKQKITYFKLDAFKMEAKNLIMTLGNHSISSSPLTSYFVQCGKSLNPIYMSEMPDVCEKTFHRVPQKLADCNHITSSVANEAEKEYKKILLYTVVKESKIYFREFDKSNDSLDEFFMRYLSDTVRFKNFTFIVKILLTLSHGQVDVECGFIYLFFIYLPSTIKVYIYVHIC